MDERDRERHAEMLGNRVRKNHKKLRKAFERERIGAYRLYDRDIPEVRAVVDWYEGHLVVGEYTRQQTEDLPGYLEALGEAAGQALGLEPERVFLRQRRTRQSEGPRYERLSREGSRIEVRERDLRFWVNLTDYLDTGLFSDHRDTREMVRSWSEGARVLNLFAYTGTFTCSAALGGAKRSVTVDLSSRYIDWARDNLVLNGLAERRHELIATDVAGYLRRPGERFDLAIVDPPSYSTSFGVRDFDVLRDHPALVESVARHVRSGGRVLMSSNHQRFEPRFDGSAFESIEEITDRTVPRDYRNRRVHRAFVLTVR